MDWLYVLQILGFALANIAFIALAHKLMEKEE